MFEVNRCVQNLPVYRARDFRVSDGVLLGEPVSFADELVLDDHYTLSLMAERAMLTITLGPRLRSFRICEGSDLGRSGNAVHLDCAVTLMGDDGSTCEALILVEVSNAMAEDIYLLPLGILAPSVTYQLVAIDRHSATRRFAQVASVSFGAGTCVTLPDGTQKPVDALRRGDLVLTRDSGPQPIRWIGRMTLRAQGSFAPVIIRAGALNNARDLCVSPDHRVLVYQRSDRIGTGRPDILVKARHLIDGEKVIQRVGGYVDYVQLLLDRHEIIFAEGLAAESLLVDQRNRGMLPDDIAQQITHTGAQQGQRVGAGYEVAENLLSRPDAVALLRRASHG